MQEEGLKISITANADDAIQKLERVNELLTQFGQSVSQGASGSIQAPDSAAFRSEFEQLKVILKNFTDSIGQTPAKIPAPDISAPEGSLNALKQRLKELTAELGASPVGSNQWRQLAGEISQVESQVKLVTAAIKTNNFKELEQQGIGAFRSIQDSVNATIERIIEFERVSDKLSGVDLSAKFQGIPVSVSQEGKIASFITLRQSAVEAFNEIRKGNTDFVKFSAVLKETESNASNAAGAISKVGNSVNNSTNGFAKTGKASKEAGVFLQNFGRVLSDLPFGLIAIQNNLDPLGESFSRVKEKTRDSGGVFKDLKEALSGPTGVLLGITAVTSGLTFLIQKYGSLGNAYDAFARFIGKFDAGKESVAAFNQELENSSKSFGTQFAELSKINGILKSTTATIDEQRVARVKFDEFIKQNTSSQEAERIKTLDNKAATEALTKALVNRALAAGAQGAITKKAAEYFLEVEKQIEAEKKLKDIQDQRKKDAEGFIPTFAPLTLNTIDATGSTFFLTSQIEKATKKGNELQDVMTKLQEKAMSFNVGVSASDNEQQMLKDKQQELKTLEATFKINGKDGDVKKETLATQQKYYQQQKDIFLLEQKIAGVDINRPDVQAIAASIGAGTYALKAENASKAAKAAKQQLQDEIKWLEELRKVKNLSIEQEQRLIDLRVKSATIELKKAGLAPNDIAAITGTIPIQVKIEGFDAEIERLQKLRKESKLSAEEQQRLIDLTQQSIRKKLELLKVDPIKIDEIVAKATVDIQIEENQRQIDEIKKKVKDITTLSTADQQQVITLEGLNFKLKYPKSNPLDLFEFFKDVNKQFKNEQKKLADIELFANIAAPFINPSLKKKTDPFDPGPTKEEMDKLKEKYEGISNLISESVTPVFDTLFSNIIEGDNAFKDMGKTLANIGKQFALAAIKAAVLAAAMQLIPGFGQAATAAGASKGFMPNFLKILGIGGTANPGSNIRQRTLQANMGQQLVAEVSGQKLQLLLQRTNNSNFRYA